MNSINSHDIYEQRYEKLLYLIPNGLHELMSDISREVLRNQPKQMCCFIADYLQSLLIVRENIKVASRFMQDMTDVSELTVELINRTGLNRKHIDKCVRTIQKAFRRMAATKKPLPVRISEKEIVRTIIERHKITLTEANWAAAVIQHAYLNFKVKLAARAEKETESKVDWFLAARRTFNIFRNIKNVKKHEYDKAATLIQAAYKGYYTRKCIDYFTKIYRDAKRKNIIQFGHRWEVPAANEMITEYKKKRAENAARIIQRFFRKSHEKMRRRSNIQTQTEKHVFQDAFHHPDFVCKSTNITDSTDYSTYNVTDEIYPTGSEFSLPADNEYLNESALIIQRFFKNIKARKKTVHFDKFVLHERNDEYYSEENDHEEASLFSYFSDISSDEV